MKPTHYIFVMALCLLCTKVYSAPYTEVSMRTTSVLLPTSDYPNSASRYGRYETASPKESYSRSMMRTGSRLLSTSLDSLRATSSLQSGTTNRVQGFANIAIRPALHTDGTVVSPRQFSSIANNGIATLNNEDEDRGDPTGGGAGTPGQITDENDTNPLPTGEGTSVLLVLAGAWCAVLTVRRRHQKC